MVLPSEIVQDIDNDKDWKIAELKHKRLIKKHKLIKFEISKIIQFKEFILLLILII